MVLVSGWVGGGFIACTIFRASRMTCLKYRITSEVTAQNVRRNSNVGRAGGRGGDGADDVNRIEI